MSEKGFTEAELCGLREGIILVTEKMVDYRKRASYVHILFSLCKGSL